MGVSVHQNCLCFSFIKIREHSKLYCLRLRLFNLFANLLVMMIDFCFTSFIFAMFVGVVGGWLLMCKVNFLSNPTLGWVELGLWQLYDFKPNSKPASQRISPIFDHLLFWLVSWLIFCNVSIHGPKKGNVYPVPYGEFMNNIHFCNSCPKLLQNKQFQPLPTLGSVGSRICAQSTPQLFFISTAFFVWS